MGSLLAAMRDGEEFCSIAGLPVPTGTEMHNEIWRAIRDVETARNRRCLVYAGRAGIDTGDHPAFCDVLDGVQGVRDLDIVLATPGGKMAQVERFVDKIRSRFDHVAFLIPHLAMSAGTIWALSGNEIWMDDERAALGPIDPQVEGRHGLIPVTPLVREFHAANARGVAATSARRPPDFSDLMFLTHVDRAEVYAHMDQIRLTKRLAARYLLRFKLDDWNEHFRDGTTPVTPDEKIARAGEIADKLLDHDEWLSHAHQIDSSTAWTKVLMQTKPLKGDVRTAIRRLWALIAAVLSQTPIEKIIASNDRIWPKPERQSS